MLTCRRREANGRLRTIASISREQPLGNGQISGAVGVEKRVDAADRKLDRGEPVAAGPHIDLADTLID
jgi:hypothetical protein